MKIKKPVIVIAAIALATVGSSQIGQLIKIVGIGAAVKQFGPQINTAINKIASHTDSATVTTKVVPILSGGIGGRKGIGAAQVMGPKALVDKVQAVAQIEQDILGREVKIRAMIPIESKDVIKDIKRVEGVGISGIVDLKL